MGISGWSRIEDKNDREAEIKELKGHGIRVIIYMDSRISQNYDKGRIGDNDSEASVKSSNGKGQWFRIL